MTAQIRYDAVIPLSPLVRRITQNNPGLFSGRGTNTHLIGTTEIIVLDPGEDRGDGHLERIVAAIGGARTVAVLPSHGHPDHWPLARPLANHLGAPLAFFGSHPGFRTDWSLGDGEVLVADGVRLVALHTPGHLGDHLAFVLEEERALFPGDVVMGWSTSIIAPPEGNLPDYLRSLDRLEALPDIKIGYPAHGEALTDPYARIRELKAHRALRTRQVLAALQQGPGTVSELVAIVYHDVDPSRHPAAAYSLRAHLLALEAEGRVAHDHADLDWSSTVWRLLAS